MAIPLIKPTIKKIRFPDELTAASALLPKNFPRSGNPQYCTTAETGSPETMEWQKNDLFRDTSLCHSQTLFHSYNYSFLSAPP